MPTCFDRALTDTWRSGPRYARGDALGMTPRVPEDGRILPSLNPHGILMDVSEHARNPARARVRRS